jgi:hypothetical protein
LVFTELILQILYWIYELLFTVESLYWIYPKILSCESYIIYFGWEIGSFLVCLTVENNAGIPENYTVDL